MTAYPRPDFRVVDVPKSVVITQAIGTALALGALTPAIRTCWVFAVRIGLSLAATIALRQGMGLGYQILIVALGVIFFTFLEVALLGIARKPRVAQAVAGRQTFEGITLLPLHMFRFLLRCVEGLRLEFDTEGQALVSTMGESTEFVVEQNLKRQYVQKFDADSWPDAWAQIRSAKVGGTTFTAAMRSGIFLGTIYFAVRMASEVSAQLVATYFAIGSYFLSLAILEGDPLRLLQVTLVCGLGVAAFCFVAFTVGDATNYRRRPGDQWTDRASERAPLPDSRIARPSGPQHGSVPRDQGIRTAHSQCRADLHAVREDPADLHRKRQKPDGSLLRQRIDRSCPHHWNGTVGAVAARDALVCLDGRPSHLLDGTDARRLCGPTGGPDAERAARLLDRQPVQPVHRDHRRRCPDCGRAYRVGVRVGDRVSREGGTLGPRSRCGGLRAIGGRRTSQEATWSSDSEGGHLTARQGGRKKGTRLDGEPPALSAQRLTDALPWLWAHPRADYAEPVNFE